MNQEDLKFTLLIICLVLASGFVGYNLKTSSCTSITGLWTHDKFDFEGSWVHVRVDNQNFTDALITCRHEVFHEVWAYCGEDNNLTFCIEQYDRSFK